MLEAITTDVEVLTNVQYIAGCVQTLQAHAIANVKELLGTVTRDTICSQARVRGDRGVLQRGARGAGSQPLRVAAASGGAWACGFVQLYARVLQWRRRQLSTCVRMYT